MTSTLMRWNTLPAADALAEILPCNGSPAWAQGLAQQRPFPHEAALLAAADTVWRALDPTAWQAAFDSHPRLGERHAKAATAASLHWSVGEQGAVSDEASARATLAAANQVYEARFGRIFLLCATGKTTTEILAALHTRFTNDPATELHEAAEQQRRITQLRLRKWLGLPAVPCEAV